MNSEKKQGAIVERRSPRNLYTSILVDVGVTYKRTLGDDAAHDFFAAHSIPAGVKTRVMTANAERRMTEWERTAHAKALLRTEPFPRALGAPGGQAPSRQKSLKKS
jgi:hypothetical protein